jgi:protein TonB
LRVSRPNHQDQTLATYRPRSAYDETPLRRRASGFALALGINLLVLLVLLALGAGRETRPKLGDDPLVVDLIAGASNAPQVSRASEAVRTPPKADERPPLPKPPIVLPVKPSLPPPGEPPWLELTKAELAAADIRNLPKVARGSGSGSAGDSEEVGRGPNGEVLYAAEWARRPTNTELGGYLPRNTPEGWGLIACRTVAGNRVEDCIELGQSPRGSRLASAVRQAAWQFRVRPPRKNGRPLVGSWVQIRIDYQTRTRDE